MNFIDRREDEEQATRWINLSHGEARQSWAELATYAVFGIDTCPDHCDSRDRLGEESCFCIRARFASSEHYFLYLELRKIAKELTAFALLSEFIKLGDKNV